MGGINSTTFYAIFPEFAAAPLSVVDPYITLTNAYYKLDTVIDSTELLNYYFLLAHFVAISTMVSDKSQIAYPAAEQTKSGETAQNLSVDYVSAHIANMTADQSFMTSTRYGQVFYLFKKKNYLSLVYGL